MSRTSGRRDDVLEQSLWPTGRPAKCRTAPRPTDTATAMTAVRHVEDSVRSFVHSALSALLIIESAPAKPREVVNGLMVSRRSHVRFLWSSRPAGRR